MPEVTGLVVPSMLVEMECITYSGVMREQVLASLLAFRSWAIPLHLSCQLHLTGQVTANRRGSWLTWSKLLGRWRAPPMDERGLRT